MITDLSKLDQKDIDLLTKHAFEESRYIRDCRKLALDMAHRTVSESISGSISKNILSEADKYYEWLRDIPEKEQNEK